MRSPKMSGTLWRSKRKRRAKRSVLPLFVLLLMMGGCGGKKAVVTMPPESSPPPPESTSLPSPQTSRQEPEPSPSKNELPRTGYSTQVGAFSNLENAILVTESLERCGLNAYYFRHKAGLYKVRFGDYSSREEARAEADRLETAGIIPKYYIVSPEDYAVAMERVYGGEHLRKEIVETAERFIGLPYRWGGSSADKGFDCSGLTMAVYQLNGLNLPRSSWAQYGVGNPVHRSELDRGDLVFFATSGRRAVSHVGVYTGDGSFIHAPGRGKKIRVDVLSNRYYAARYMGARSYVPEPSSN